MRQSFDPAAEKQALIRWIQKWFSENGEGCFAVVGISGGKDSSVVAALCAEALGKDRVVGVMLPNGEQPDIDDSMRVVQALGIWYFKLNIEDAFKSIRSQVKQTVGMVSNQTTINLPPRLRMATLYAVSQSVGGRVANTCNYSEEFVGYSTRWGDSVGDFAPLANLTSDEVVQIGLLCKELPEDLVLKTPSDGLCGKTDEDSFGFTYEQLNAYIWNGIRGVPADVAQRIEAMHRRSAFKRSPIPAFSPSLS